VAAGQHLGALLDGVATWSTIVSSCGGKVIAPTSTVPGPSGAPCAARDLLGDLRDELVVDGLLDVHALDRDARLAGVLHRVVGGEVGGALEVGVGQHDHRVLAAELERGDQPPAPPSATLRPVASSR
jgi:hypothetical protein